jgi:hypothetical protein
VKDEALAAFDHQDLPFEKLVEELRPERSLARPPLLQVALAMQEAPATVALPGLTLLPLPAETGAAKLDLVLSLDGSPTGYAGTVRYVREVFDASTMARFAAYFTALLEDAVAAPERRLSTLPLLPAAELHQVLRVQVLGRFDPPVKVSGARIESQEIEAAGKTAYAAPRHRLEGMIAAVFQEVLGRKQVGVHDNFFDLGGHSLLVVEVNHRLARQLGREIPILVHFQHTTVSALAGYLDRPLAEEPALAGPSARGQGRKAAMERQRRRRESGRPRTGEDLGE